MAIEHCFLSTSKPVVIFLGRVFYAQSIYLEGQWLKFYGFLVQYQNLKFLFFAIARTGREKRRTNAFKIPAI